MPIGIGIPLRIEIRGTIKGQACMVRQWYETDGAAFLTADPTGVGEAFWNHIKTAWRAMHIGDGVDFTQSIFVAEDGPTGAYGEYAIPTGEQTGLRSGAGLGSSLPAYSAGGIRLTVGSRVTRPGQKRFWGLYELDADHGDLVSAGYATLLDGIGPMFSAPLTLGAPVALGVLNPIIVSMGGTPPVVVASQPVTGYLVHPYVTSQVSRKVRP